MFIDALLLAAGYWTDPNSYIAIFKVVLGLGAVIFVHELGHFLLAKACGVKCDKFYVGFDAFDIKLGDRVIIPRRLVHWQWGETEYGIGILPFGGYVKMLGQDDNPGNLEEEVRKSMKDGDESVSSALTPEGLIDRTKIDPRSYLAKSVPQRMAIISAGVIFNLLFAILFAAFAFRSGVNYEPASIGRVVGGAPAWKHNLAGSELIQVGEAKVENYFTRNDLFQEVGLHGEDTPLAIEITRPGSSQPTKLDVQLQSGLSRNFPDISLMGISGRTSTTLADPVTVPGSPAAVASPSLAADDKIVEIAGVPIESDLDIYRVLIEKADATVDFVLERPSKDSDAEATERVTTTIARNPQRLFGFTVEWEPVTAIQIGSPADTAGIQEGDVITLINGQPRGDLLTLNQRMIRLAAAGETANLTIQRDGEELEITVQPKIPIMLSSVGDNGPVSIDALGVAIPASRVVATISDATLADAAGVQVGDEILAVTYALSDEQKADELLAPLAKDPRKDLVEGRISWAEIDSTYQTLAPGTKLELEVMRGSQQKTVSATTTASDDLSRHTRGIVLVGAQDHYEATDWSDALYHGARQVRNDSTKVLKTFGKLISGKISPKNLGGPGTIALAATSEASEGTSRLLLFLTFLSANLAVVNFLPIPVLDGGHMLFLAYEGIFRRPVNEKTQILLTYVGLAMILCLMLFVVALDASRIYSMF